MSEIKRCSISETRLKYYKEDWPCSKFEEQFIGDIRYSNCVDCNKKRDELAKERDRLAKEAIDNAPFVNADPNPIATSIYTPATNLVPLSFPMPEQLHPELTKGFGE